MKPVEPRVHTKELTTCSGLMKTALNNVLRHTLFNAVKTIAKHCYTSLQADSGSTLLNNIVDNIEQCREENVAQACLLQS